ncbi:unnamed protein product [Hymenolepis diminuta]|uniref:RRM domain-containing protein n=1 Tax=Hymenolepis diminuta TaxID=6216 RepID=A0A0R3SR59_HYMDI|nr:unnamed protein product [Hymenolepis diminuta]
MNPLAIQRSVPSSVSNIVVPKIGTIIPNRIFVGGISSNTTEDDLRKFFEKYGHVKDVKIIFDHSILSKGNYGFITFENQEIAEWLIKHEGESLIFNNRKLNISHAIRKQVYIDGNGSINFSNPSMSCNMTNEIPCISVNNQTAQITTSYVPSQNVIISQNNSAEVKYDLPQTMSSTGTPVIQVPSNTFTIHREQPNSCPSNSVLIPPGSILLTHASVYIPNGSAVEVLHTPQTQMTTLSQQNGSNEQNLCSNQHNTSCYQKLKPQDYTSSLNDWTQQRPRFQQPYSHRGELPFQQEKSSPTNINLLQQILLNNCALVENSVETPVVEKYVS